LDALMSSDLIKLVIDDEIAQMLKRIVRGLEFTPQNLALDAIAQVGPGGLFVDTQHTRHRMRRTALLPQIADRNPREQWQARGALDVQGRAMLRVREMLSRDNPAVFSPDLDALIRARFDGLVAGDARPAAGSSLPGLSSQPY